MVKSNILVRSKLKQAQVLVSQNKLSEAKTLYTQLYSKNKFIYSIGLNLAVIHRRLGEYNETISICKNIINVSPNNAAAHHILGSALQCLGQFEAAISRYKKAIEIDNKLTEAHYFLGNIYQQTGKLELAIESLYEAIRLNPNFYEALNNLGAILIELKRPIEAREIINKALKIDPNSIQLQCNLAGLYRLEDKPDKALKHAKKAYASDPSFLDAIKLMGNMHYLNNEYDEALAFYRKAYAISRDDEITCFIAQILERRGEFDEAHKLIRPIIEAGKTDIDSLLTFSSLSRRFKNESVAIEALERKINNSDIDDTSLIKAHSELGKQYDLLKKYDKAFINYKKANLLEREQNNQVEALIKKTHLDNTNKNDIDKWFKIYPKEFWDNIPCSNNRNMRPIFVIGMFRSGTTLCEQILSSHPDVHGVGELTHINKLSYEIGNSKPHDKTPASLINITQDKLIKAADSYLSIINNHSTDAKRIVDKMPTNYIHLGLISKLFPNAHIVHMVRDPRDVCLSMYFQRFGPQMPFTTDLVELANYHLSYQRVMQYWHEVLDIKIHNVVYEELTRDQEKITRNILDFCGLEWDDRCMSFYKTKRDVNTPSYDQVRKPIYKNSVARWKNYEEYLKPLTDRLELKE